MNIKIVTLALISIVVAGFAVGQPASAQGARFKYAANVWSAERATGPKSYHVADPVHSVKSGAVPHGKSFLGLDPNMLAKPTPVPAPIAQQSVTATPSFAQVVPTMAAPKTNFNQQFGKPLSLNPPVIAQAPMVAPPIGQAAAPKALTAKPAVHKPAVARATRSSKDVHGTIRARKAAPAGNGMLAEAGKGVESYGKDFGYVPGAYLPAASSGSGFTSADVHGTILHR